MPRFPDWRTEQSASAYPFEDRCSRQSEDGFVIPLDGFLDASFYIAGGGDNVRISKLTVEADRLLIEITDDNESVVTGEYEWNGGAETIRLVDENDRAAGVLVTEPLRISAIQAWGDGERLFGDDDAVFASVCSLPLPATGVSGILLDDGTTLTGDVILVADDGLAFSCDTKLKASGCGHNTESQTVVRLHAVGDPLFLRKKCEPNLFSTPRFLRELVFQIGEKRIAIGPGDDGSVLIAQAPVLVDDTILRVEPISNGLRFETVGERLSDIR